MLIQSRLRWVPLALVWLLAAPPALADERGAPAALHEAEQHHARGVLLYRERHYAEALSEFEQAYALHPDPRLLFSLGQLQYALERHAAALLSLKSYLTRAGSAAAPERRREVERQIEALRQKTGYISVSVNVPGARVGIDGADAGLSPVSKPVLVDAGNHRVTATHPDHAASSVLVHVSGTELTEAALHLVPLRHSGASTSFEKVAWITTGSLGALALTSAIVTFANHRSYENARKQPGEGDAAAVSRGLQDHQQRVSFWAAATDVLAGAALLSGGVALYVTLASDDAHPAAGSEAILPSGAELRASFEF